RDEQRFKFSNPGDVIPTAMMDAATKEMDASLRCTFYVSARLTVIRMSREAAENTGAPKGTVRIYSGFIGTLQDPHEFICLPDRATLTQMIAVFHKWANDHPQWLHEAADIHFGAALSVAFPCRQIKPD